MIQGFREFVMKNQVLGLAVAVIVGGAIGKVVASLVADIIMPLVSLLIPGGEWRTAQLILSKTVGADGKEVVNAISYGNFAGSIVDFIVIAFCIYLIAKTFIKEEAPAPPSKVCPRCRETVAADATRCKFCTTDI